MTRPALPTARGAYLASLSSDDELTARRTAEKSGIPDDDPTWLLLGEVRRASLEVSSCTDAIRTAASDAASRIEQTAQSTDQRLLGGNETLIAAIAGAVAAKVVEHDRVVDAIVTAARRVEQDAVRAVRALEVAIREAMRRRAAAPAASLAFAFALGIASACLSLWVTYHAALGYGESLGYRAGFHDARVYDARSHR